MPNMQMNSCRSVRFKSRQLETIGNIRIEIMYSVRGYCDMYFTLDKCNSDVL